ncbi:hypothetical protein BJX66DRAFT_320868 [Aspergillus keveii]|uniref:Granulins domain-containing protein n=1 Tax=Aspergillus keveii TaxID=714993 RepID=A0ABR4FGM7_9EURO
MPRGAECCYLGDGYCPAGETCCPDNTCAPVGGKCCYLNGGTCDAGEQCCHSGGCCAPADAECCLSDGFCPAGSKCSYWDEVCCPLEGVLRILILILVTMMMMMMTLTLTLTFPPTMTRMKILMSISRSPCTLRSSTGTTGCTTTLRSGSTSKLTSTWTLTRFHLLRHPSGPRQQPL